MNVYTGIMVGKTFRGNHTPGFSEFCLPGKWVGPDSCIKSMTGDDKPETKLADATTDDAMSFSSSLLKSVVLDCK